MGWADTSPEKRKEQAARKRIKRAMSKQNLLEVDLPAKATRTYDELRRERVESFVRKVEYEESHRLITAHVRIPGPYGVLHFGDPHLDDDGCDWISLQNDIDAIKSTPALFCANVGDTTNNWVGRLAHLFGQQKTTAKEAMVLAEGFFRELKGKWLYIIQGNHDAWSGEGDPMGIIADSIGALYESSEARIKINSPSGSSVVVNARHDFAGGSIYNPCHGPAKAFQFGVRDNIIICGHKHKSGYLPLRDPATGLIGHCIQVASYKYYDRYAKEKGFRDQTMAPRCITIVNPEADTPTGLIQVFWDTDIAVDYLKFLRNRMGYK